LGDILCANRFIPAILEKIPDAEITAYLDTEGNKMQEEALRTFYPHFYKDIITIPSKKYKPFFVNTQFGIDQNFGALENIPNEYVAKMANSEVFLDLHIDGMQWTKYDFPYLKYFYSFPTPRINTSYTEKLPDKFVLMHLASNNLANAHRMSSWYVTGLVKKIAEKYPVVLLSTPSTRDYLNFAKDINNVQIIETGLTEVVDIINKCSVMVAIDSGLRFLAYGCGKPVYTFSAQATELGRVLPSHKLRWLMYENSCVPLYFDNSRLATIVKNTVDNPALWLCPEVQDFDLQCVVRKYTVNTEKSILS